MTFLLLWQPAQVRPMLLFTQLKEMCSDDPEEVPPFQFAKCYRASSEGCDISEPLVGRCCTRHNANETHCYCVNVFCHTVKHLVTVSLSCCHSKAPVALSMLNTSVVSLFYIPARVCVCACRMLSLAVWCVAMGDTWGRTTKKVCSSAYVHC